MRFAHWCALSLPFGLGASMLQPLHEAHGIFLAAMFYLLQVETEVDADADADALG